MNQTNDIRTKPVREILVHTLTDKSWLYYVGGAFVFFFLLFSFAIPKALFVPIGLMFISLESMIWASTIVGSLIALGISSIVLERTYRKLRFYDKVFKVVAQQYEKDPDFATKIEHAHNTTPCLEIRYLMMGVLGEKFWIKNNNKTDNDYAVTINKSTLDEILRVMMENKHEISELRTRLDTTNKGKSTEEQIISKNIKIDINSENIKSTDPDENLE